MLATMEKRQAARGSVVPSKPPPQCSIAFWRGYVSAQFYAKDSNGGGILALSPTFRTWRLPWQRPVPMRENPAALAALESLKVELRTKGWVPMRRKPGSDWYEFRFRLGKRPSAAPGSLELLELTKPRSSPSRASRNSRRGLGQAVPMFGRVRIPVRL
jgi:hypothetical protein